MTVPIHKRFQRRPDGYSALRVYHRKARGKLSPRLLVKCGDCDNALEIFYDPEEANDIEIGGVLGSVENWREILLPLLDPKRGVIRREHDIRISGLPSSLQTAE